MKKFLIILSFLLLPFSAMAANTNAFDRVIVNSNFTSLGLVRILANQTNTGIFVVTNSIDSGMRNLFNPAGVAVVNWSNLFLLDNSGFQSVNWTTRGLLDTSGNTSVNWSQRLLRDDQNITALTWNNRRFQDSSGNDVWNFSNQVFSVTENFSSNIVVTGTAIVLTTNGTSLVSSGTNNLMTISVNGGAGTLKTQAMLTMTTNPPTGTIVVNTIFTNDTFRLWVSAPVRLPSSLTDSSAAALWSVSGSTTNVTGLVSSEAGLGGVITNTVYGWVQPSALYMITNVSAGGGAPTAIQSNYREVRN